MAEPPIIGLSYANDVTLLASLYNAILLQLSWPGRRQTCFFMGCLIKRISRNGHEKPMPFIQWHGTTSHLEPILAGKAHKAFPIWNQPALRKDLDTGTIEVPISFSRRQARSVAITKAIAVQAWSATTGTRRVGLSSTTYARRLPAYG